MTFSLNDGSKTTTWRRHIVGWTTLPGKVYDADGKVWGDALLRFSLARDLRKLLRSFTVGPRAERKQEVGKTGS